MLKVQIFINNRNLNWQYPAVRFVTTCLLLWDLNGYRSGSSKGQGQWFICQSHNLGTTSRGDYEQNLSKIQLHVLFCF